MKKNTLKGKTKMLSYIIAFAIMIGVHLIMDKTRAEKEHAEIEQKSEKHSVKIDNGIAQADYLLPDSLPAGKENNKKTSP